MEAQHVDAQRDAVLLAVNFAGTQHVFIDILHLNRLIQVWCHIFQLAVRAILINIGHVHLHNVGEAVGRCLGSKLFPVVIKRCIFRLDLDIGILGFIHINDLLRIRMACIPAPPGDAQRYRVRRACRRCRSWLVGVCMGCCGIPGAVIVAAASGKHGQQHRNSQ
ncbi:hypothetical protein D3C74_385100 [compost metagenome]